MTPQDLDVYAPHPEFASAANAGPELYDQAAKDRLAFWGEQAARLDWSTPFEQVLDWSEAPFAKWFVGGKLNVAANCLDRHVAAGLGDKVALHWVGETGERRDITYAELTALTSQTANLLVSFGLKAGDRAAIYLPMIPEAIAAMLACARLGVTHTVVFAGFSAAALKARIEDSQAKLVVTADGQYRKGAPAPLKAAVDEALAELDAEGENPVEHVLVVRRTGIDVEWTGRDAWWDETVPQQPTTHEPEAFDAEHPLFLLYTSGTTGSPKGVLHSSGGYLVQTAYTHHVVFDHKPETDVYWCTADIGWVTGHGYIVYGPMANAATQVLYEGVPNYPDEHRHFKVIEELGVTIYYTAPTLIRTFMKWGQEIPDAHDLSSLRLLGSVGEPINPEAWHWYRKHIGADRTPIVDTWWQTETGAIMISPLPGATATKPGAAMAPLPGISAKVVDERGDPIAPGANGYLVLDQPWPAMLRGIWGDAERFKETYWSQYKKDDWYFAGDGARLDEDGALWVLGRVDDVMNVSGHRISTAEVESALVGHGCVAEAAVVGAADETTGQAVVAFAVLRHDAPSAGPALIAELKGHVSTAISPIARPRNIYIVPELPKTRSGKIMRRLLRDLAEHRAPGDVSTLVDSGVFEAIKSVVEK